MNNTPPPLPSAAREYARRRILARRDVPLIAVTWIVVAALTTGIWLQNGGSGHFWPTWPMLGVGIAVFAAAFAAYGPRTGYVNDADIDHEAARLTR